MNNYRGEITLLVSVHDGFLVAVVEWVTTTKQGLEMLSYCLGEFIVRIKKMGRCKRFLLWDGLALLFATMDIRS